MTPHVLRHTAAMQLLRHGIDRSVIALWLGHESVETIQIYLHADLRQKEVVRIAWHLTSGTNGLPPSLMLAPSSKFEPVYFHSEGVPRSVILAGGVA